MAAHQGGPDGEGIRPSDADLARRLNRLSRELDTEREERAAETKPARTDTTNYAAAFRLASEFVAGVVVGALLGWGLDRLAGTSPWGLIGFVLLGFAAGVLNVVRAASQMSGSTATKNGRGEPH
jgi:ATP synthase protein I